MKRIVKKTLLRLSTSVLSGIALLGIVGSSFIYEETFLKGVVAVCAMLLATKRLSEFFYVRKHIGNDARVDKKYFFYSFSFWFFAGLFLILNNYVLCSLAALLFMLSGVQLLFTHPIGCRICFNRYRKTFIPTPLPLVYLQETNVFVKSGLDRTMKKQLWGINFHSGLMIALKCEKDVSSSCTSAEKMKDFVQNLVYDGKKGSLPSKEVLEKGISNNERKKLSRTIKVLKKNGVDVDAFYGKVWSAQEYSYAKNFFEFQRDCLDENNDSYVTRKAFIF